MFRFPAPFSSPPMQSLVLPSFTCPDDFAQPQSLQIVSPYAHAGGRMPPLIVLPRTPEKHEPLKAGGETEDVSNRSTHPLRSQRHCADRPIRSRRVSAGAQESPVTFPSCLEGGKFHALATCPFGFFQIYGFSRPRHLQKRPDGSAFPLSFPQRPLRSLRESSPSGPGSLALWFEGFSNGLKQWHSLVQVDTETGFGRIIARILQSRRLIQNDDQDKTLTTAPQKESDGA